MTDILLELDLLPFDPLTTYRSFTVFTANLKIVITVASRELLHHIRVTGMKIIMWQVLSLYINLCTTNV